MNRADLYKTACLVAALTSSLLTTTCDDSDESKQITCGANSAGDASNSIVTTINGKEVMKCTADGGPAITDGRVARN